MDESEQKKEESVAHGLNSLSIFFFLFVSFSLVKGFKEREYRACERVIMNK